MSIFRFVAISKTSKKLSSRVLFRPSKSGGSCKYLDFRIICNLCDGIEIDLFYLDGIGKQCNFAAEIQ